MALITCGVALGFVLSSVLFMQKVWRLQDALNEAKHKAKFYKNECGNLTRQIAEWETVCEERGDLFGKW